MIVRVLCIHNRYAFRECVKTEKQNKQNRGFADAKHAFDEDAEQFTSYPLHQ